MDPYFPCGGLSHWTANVLLIALNFQWLNLPEVVRPDQVSKLGIENLAAVRRAEFRRSHSESSQSAGMKSSNQDGNRQSPFSVLIESEPGSRFLF
jgi:hypothetical protein